MFHDLCFAILLLKRFHNSTDINQTIEEVELLFIQGRLGLRHSILNSSDDCLADIGEIVRTL